MTTILLPLLLALLQPAHADGLDGLSLTALGGAPLEAAALEGKVVLVVNVASRCGFTHQYADLQALYEAHAAQGLVVLGAPCDQFGGQEPGDASEIQTFCRLNYGVTFPLLEKQDVNGPGRGPLYQHLIGDGPDVTWNFEKFLVGRGGEVLARFPPQTSPTDPRLVAAIEAALADDR